MAPDDPPRNTQPVVDPGIADPLIGAVLDGRYRILGPVGSGGVADVYRGETVGVARRVAIKVLQEDFGVNENLRGRFDREARALASLSHPHIVTMIDYGVTEGMPYLVMELLEGQTLRDLLDKGPLPSERAFAITRQIVRALVFAHGQGLVHRDLKPANVFLLDLPGHGDHVKILDFGFAKFLEGDDGGPVLTRTGMVFGTPPYMAPEQVSGDGMDGRCDVYATAVLLFEMFADRRPFEGETQELLRAKLTQRAPRLSEVATELTVRPELDALLARALAAHPSDRFPTAADFGAALDAVPQPAAWPKGGWDSLVGDAPAAVPPAPPNSPTAGRAPALGKLAPPPRPEVTWKLLLGFGIAAAVVMLLVCGGALTWWLRNGEATPQAEPGLALPASDPAAYDPPSATAAVPAADPWSAPMPPDMAEALQKFRTHGEATGDDVKAVRQLARQYPDDPRPHLLTGHLYFERRWRSDAIERYQLAHQVSRSAKGDPTMLANLVTMAAGPAPLGTKAAEALQAIYGAAAVDAVDAALAGGSLDARSRQRLEQVRTQLLR
jgi:eukaryotic-like serine/threonine-protein kinase